MIGDPDGSDVSTWCVTGGGCSIVQCAAALVVVFVINRDYDLVMRQVPPSIIRTNCMFKNH